MNLLSRLRNLMFWAYPSILCKIRHWLSSSYGIKQGGRDDLQSKRESLFNIRWSQSISNMNPQTAGKLLDQALRTHLVIQRGPVYVRGRVHLSKIAQNENKSAGLLGVRTPVWPINCHHVSSPLRLDVELVFDISAADYPFLFCKVVWWKVILNACNACWFVWRKVILHACCFNFFSSAFISL